MSVECAYKYCMGDVHPCSCAHSIETMQFLGRSVENNYKTFHKERKLKSELGVITIISSPL